MQQTMNPVRVRFGWLLLLFSAIAHPTQASDGVAVAGKSPVKVNSRDGAEMVLVPAGEFLMGTSPEQLAACLRDLPLGEDERKFNDEAPQHKVQLDAYAKWAEAFAARMKTTMIDNNRNYQSRTMSKLMLAAIPRARSS